MYQSITMIGNLGNDVELRYTPAGVPVASFSLAVNKRFTNANGETTDKSTWFKVTCWRKQAEIVAEHLRKGSKVMVVGEVEEARAFTDRSGNNRASLEVTAQLVKFLDGRGNIGDDANVAVNGGDDGEAIPF